MMASAMQVPIDLSALPSPRCWTWLAAALFVLAFAFADCRPKVRVGSFNIRVFPSDTTDRQRVAEAVAELDADIFGVQEIVDPEALRDVLARASSMTGRDYDFVLARCRTHASQLATGIVWDASRWTLDEQREYPDLLPDDGEDCGKWPPAVFGAFSGPRGQRLGVVSVHFPPFPRNYRIRQVFWGRLLKIQRDESARMGATVLALGDFNSTGFRGQPAEERDHVEGLVDAAGYRFLSRDIECTEYYRPPHATTFLPSILDHVVATGGAWSSASVLGLCRRLACEETAPEQMDPDFHRVSDHCPIVVEGTPAG